MSQDKIRHDWFQSDSVVTISIYVKKAEKEDVETIFGDSNLSVTIKLPGNSDWNLELDPLFQEIIPLESSYNILSTQVQVMLVKKVKGIKWTALEGSASPSNIMASMAAKTLGYPSSSRKKQDWDSLVKEADSEKPEGEQALNSLFQSIYANASEDTKRAMMKSYVESNGTCLSTNWEDIGKRKVDVTPPDGMIAQKFEK